MVARCVSVCGTGFDRHIMTVAFVLGTPLLQVFIPYRRYVFFLKLRWTPSVMPQSSHCTLVKLQNGDHIQPMKDGKMVKT